MTATHQRSWFVVPVLAVFIVAWGPDTLRADTDAAALLAGMAKATGFQNGLVVHVGCDDASLVRALATRPGVLAQGLVDGAEELGAVRAQIQAAGLAGTASVRGWRSAALPYADGVVDLLVATDGTAPSTDEALRVLTPGGALCVRQPNGTWNVTRNPIPAGLDDWSHFLHAPDNVPVSSDTTVGYPTGLQWVAGPWWTRDHDTTPSVSGMVTAGGRLFYILDEGPIGVVDRRLPSRHAVYARNAYNGVMLWRRPIPNWTPSHQWWGTIPEYLHRAMVAGTDRLYVTDGLNGQVVALDAATGKELTRFAGTKGAAELIKTGRALIVGLMDPASGKVREYPTTREQPLGRAGIKAHRRRGKTIAAYETVGGTELWSTPSVFVPLTFCSDGASVYVAEDKGLRALDLGTGAEQWQVPVKATKLMFRDGVLVACVEAPRDKKTRRPNIVVRGLSAKDGSKLWEASGQSLPTFTHCFYIAPEVLLAQGRVWLTAKGSTVGLDLKTGELKTQISMKGTQTPGHHVRCYPAKATDRFAMFNKRGIEFLSWEGGAEAGTKHDWLRGTCRLGIVPTNGLIYTPPHGCNCYVEAILRGMVAYNPRVVKLPRSAPGNRLEKGPAYASPLSSTPPPRTRPSHSLLPTQSDWPTFRGDPERRSVSRAEPDGELAPAWMRTFPSRVTPPVLAAGKLVVAETDARTVYCLEADNGKPLWSFMADGRIDSPPTLALGMAVFGAADGRVYALRLADGALCWRFRAAPADMQTVAFGQLESLWPCHGSVLVQDGLVYTAAGRSGHLDGGITVYALDLATGEVRHQCNVTTPRKQETSGRETFNTAGALNDILVSDGTHIYMRHIKFSKQLERLSSQYPIDETNHSAKPRMMASSGFLDTAENKRTFRRFTTEWNGRYSPLRTQQLAADDRAVYGCRIHYGRGWKTPRYHLGDGTLVFAQDHAEAAKIAAEPARKAAQRGLGNVYQFGIPKDSFRWQTPLPLYAKAVVLAGSSLFVAGRHDRSHEDMIRIMDGKAAGLLVRLSAADGKAGPQTTLSAPPVTDGLIVGNGRLFVSLQDSTLLCLAAR